MAQRDYDIFLAEHNVTSISELDEDGLLSFSSKFMDNSTFNYIRLLKLHPLGITPDWEKVASLIERAFVEHKKFRLNVITGESYSAELARDSRLNYFLEEERD